MDIKHVMQNNIYHNKIITILSPIIKNFRVTFVTSVSYYLRRYVTDTVGKI